MNIPGHSFRRVTGTSLYNGPGIFIYVHQETGKCFVRALRNARVQRSKNNYPKYLKELLKTKTCEVSMYFAEVDRDTKDALYLASRDVLTKLSETGKLYKRPKPNRSMDAKHPDGTPIRYTAWSMTHIDTGAVYYFEEIAGVDVLDKVAQRLRTFNNYVAKSIVNSNRVLYYFTKQNYPLSVDGFVLRDLQLDVDTEQRALKHITLRCKVHLEAEEVVLNKVCNADSLYYRNAFLKLEHKTIDQYLQPVAA